MTVADNTDVDVDLLADEGTARQGTGGAVRLTPLRFVIGIGIVSALGDWVYEGAAANIGPLLEHLGATAAVVGIITGIGQALAYGIRLISGPVIDRTRK